MSDTPRYRPTARVLLLDPQDRLLLFHVQWRDHPLLWATPGGGQDQGETMLQAAQRELYEETGQREGVVWGPAVWERRHVWGPPERRVESHEHFFLARTPRCDVTVLDPHEQRAIRGWRWWDAAALEAAMVAGEHLFAPRRLAMFLPPLLRGELPAALLDVGT